MLVGEMCLLLLSAIIMIGLVKGITQLLGLNDFLAAFAIFVIVLLNVRGEIIINKSVGLSIGGIILILLSFYLLIKKSEKANDFWLAIGSMLICGAITFISYYSLSHVLKLNIYLVMVISAILAGLAAALGAKRTFVSSLFSSNIGSLLGITVYSVITNKHLNIAGGYLFATMVLTMIAGISFQYFLTKLMRKINVAQASAFFEAGEMKEEDDEEDKKMR